MQEANINDIHEGGTCEVPRGLSSLLTTHEKHFASEKTTPQNYIIQVEVYNFHNY